jgi:ankyrin repeat protein
MNAQILDFYLLQAVEMGDHEMVKALLEHGADFNAQNDKRQPVLLIAASRGHRNVVEALLTYPGVYNIQGVTRGVKEAARGNHKAIVRMLVNHGAVVDENDPIVMKVLAELENKADVFLAGSHE